MRSTSSPVMPAAGSSSSISQGLLREHDAELHHLALAVSELADQPPRDARRSTAAAITSATMPARHRAQRADAARRQPDVLLARVRPFITDGTCVLMPTPSRTISCGRQPVVVLAADEHAAVAVVEPDLPGQAFEERALAGAVRADQAAQLVLGEREADAFERLHAAEAHRQVVRFDAPSRSRGAPRRRAGGARCSPGAADAGARRGARASALQRRARCRAAGAARPAIRTTPMTRSCRSPVCSPSSILR